MSDHDMPAAAAGTVTVGDLTVNRMGFGAMRVTGSGIWGPPRDHDESIRVLRRALELGVNFIDTADSYGPKVSEELIAEALHPYPDGLVIATKAGLVRPGPNRWIPNGRPDHLRKAVEGSLERLRVDRIDVLQLHRPDPKVPFEDSLGTLKAMQDEGKIRHIGLSNVNAGELEFARGIVDVVSVQNMYNVTERRSDAVLDACEAAGLPFLPWRPVLGGQLTGPGSPLGEAAERHGATPGQLALAWLLHRSPVMLPIPGTSSVAHLEENVAAGAIGLDDDDLRAFEAAA
ncbi:MAG TPA: aldo/keto reductase [Actinomycetota bacterium]|nr:aldo/keto reductase [Actinomycetota bacterium]